MDNLYNNVKLWRDTYAESKMLYGVDMKNGQGVWEEIIQQEVKSKKTGQSERRSKSGGDQG